MFYPKGGKTMKTWTNIFLVSVLLGLLLSGCTMGVSRNGYIRDKSPAFSVNEPHDLDYYQMYGY
jgi:hypothetical protein